MKCWTFYHMTSWPIFYASIISTLVCFIIFSLFFDRVNILYFKNLITRNLITTYYLVVLYLTGDYRATLHVSKTNSALGASGKWNKLSPWSFWFIYKQYNNKKVIYNTSIYINQFYISSNLLLTTRYLLL